jgi:pimeloyl-ACP methyl ester carboxylesterase
MLAVFHAYPSLWFCAASLPVLACNASPQASPDGPPADGGCPTGTEAQVEVQVSGGAFVGTLRTPDGCGPHPLVLVFPGSGPTDRDGNDTTGGLNVKTDAYKELAAALAASGIASVRYDKRCVGASVCGITSGAMLTFDDEVQDALAWARQYVHDPRFTGLTLAGHSEGSLWAILIAEQLPVAAVVSLEGAGRPIGQVLSEQLGTQLASDPGLLMQANQIIASLEAGMMVSNVPSQLAALFGPSAQPYLISWMRYDPARELAKLSQPILVVQGTTDAQVSEQDANLLLAANPHAQALLVDGMCHTLKDAPAPPASQNQAYTDPSLPLDPNLVSGVVRFIRARP